MKAITKKYTNGEVTVIWKPNICIHSAVCFNGLPQVFDPRSRPWVNIGGADTERIVNQVKQCPSGALTYFMNHEQENFNINVERIVGITNGCPLLVYGKNLIKDGKGVELSGQI
ncbi:hypothetical protein C0389_10455 [bacterium]|nr:hypothetical protein [bacterium]